MNTREIAAEYRLTHWAQIMHERSESGLSVKAFCEKVGMRENVFYYWQRKLRKVVCEQIIENQEVGSPQGLVPAGFSEIRVLNSSGELAKSEAGGQISIEAAGVRISADDTYPPEKLAALLRELTRPC